MNKPTLYFIIFLHSLFLIFLSPLVYSANNNVLNLYSWSQEIPLSVIKQFESETGIKVNHSTYDSNEIMYAKLRASNNMVYDIVEPSSYFVDHMRQQNMLEKLDKTKLPNIKNIDPIFVNQTYDFQNQYSIPIIWGTTGIFVNFNDLPRTKISRWSDLLDKKYKNKLLLLDDSREAFSIALLMLGYSINDSNPEHIKQAYLKLRELSRNIRLFNTDAVISIMIDEDAAVGVSWNGDFYKAEKENKKLQFVYPKENFEIWVDNLVIPKNAPHLENAYKFLNFMLRADIAKKTSLAAGYPTPNLAAKQQLPEEIKNNPFLYPKPEVLKRGEFETYSGNEIFVLREKYWERLKMEV